MSFFRMYSTPDGESHIEDIEQVPVKATEVRYAKGAVGTFSDWHVERRKQFVIQLSGEAEHYASDGQMRKTTPGSVKLAEDLTGKGHRTKVIGDKECVWMFVVVAE